MATTKITVKSRTDAGRWRGGRHFTREGVDLPMTELSEAELTVLKGDPELIVLAVYEPEPEQEPEPPASEESAAPAEANATTLRKGKGK